MISTTIGSSLPHEAKLRMFLPPSLLAEVHARYDELQALQAAPADRARHARNAKSAAKRKLCEDAINDTRNWLDNHGPSERVSHLLEHLGKHRELYGYTELPSREYIKGILREQGL